MLNVIDLFAGAGGFGLGFKMAGFNICCSLEVDHWASETLRANQKNSSIIIEDNIKNYTERDKILYACKGQLPDVIIGGPPCQGFSNAAPAHKKDPKDPRNTLFKNFAIWVENLKPSIFVMENVKGILTRLNYNKEKVVDIIIQTFEEIGYSVEIWNMNAVEFGVPQIRKRVFIVGNNLGKIIDQPRPTHYYHKNHISKRNTIKNNANDKFKSINTWEAISDLPDIDAWEGLEEQPYYNEPKNNYQKWARDNNNILYNHVAMKHSKRMIERFKQIKFGKSGADAPEKYKAKKRNGNGEISKVNFKSNNRRLTPDAPSYTIPAHFYSSFIHPYKHRNITAREAARIQSFPDWYRFMGKRTVISRKLLERYKRHNENYLSQYNQIGNAVPPLLAKAIADHILLFFENHQRQS